MPNLPQNEKLTKVTGGPIGAWDRVEKLFPSGAVVQFRVDAHSVHDGLILLNHSDLCRRVPLLAQLVFGSE